MKLDGDNPVRPKNMQYLRNQNRAAILKRLAVNGPTSRQELSIGLGLTKMAISTIVGEMLEGGILQEGWLHSPEGGKVSGRKPIPLSVPSRRINALGVYIYRYQIACIAVDINGKQFAHRKCGIPPDANNTLFEQLVLQLVQRVLDETKEYTYIGIGIASIGPVDTARQWILSPPKFGSIHQVAIGDKIRERFQLPVLMDNDMNVGALAEHFYGIGKSVDNLVYIGFGSGVGAGVIIGGRMLHGKGGYAGELGHISIQSDGPICSCGRRGCLELYTNTPNLLEQAGVASVGALGKLLRSPNAPESVVGLMEQYYSAVLNALVSVANLFDPEMIVIGDQGAQLIEPELCAMEGRMNALMFQQGSGRISLRIAGFGKKSPLIGATALVFQQVFRGMLAVE